MSFLDSITYKFTKQNNQPEFFLALNLAPNLIEAAIFGQINGQVKVLGQAFGKYSSQLDLTQKAAETIDEASQKAAVDFSKVIFGLPSDWIEEEKVVSPYGQLIKKLAKDLDLEPLAFVSTQQALTHLIEIKESSPPTLMLIGCFEKQFNLSLVKTGRVEAGKTVARLSSDLVSEISEAVSNFAQFTPLPSRVILYGSVDLNKLSSEINSRDWTKLVSTRPDLPVFLHALKVEVYSLGSSADAIVLAGATDLGFLANIPTFAAGGQIGKELKTSPQESVLRDQQASDEFDFVEGEDIIRRPVVEEKATQPQTAIEEPEKENLDLLNLKNQAKEEIVTVENSFLGWTKKIQDFFSKRNITMLVPFLAIILILAGIVLLYWFLPKAQIALKVRSQALDKEAEIVASKDFDQVSASQIPAQILEINQKGSQKAVASGKKTVGDKAKGDVTLFNKTTAPKNFEAGVILTASGGIKFSLDADVSVASRSSTIEGIIYGKGQVSATAVAIGTESNIAAGQDLTIDGFDTSLYLARNEKAFSGGTSREVTVVSEDDLTRLEKNLASDLLQKAEDEIASKIAQDQKVLDQAVIKEVINKSFDKDVDDESSVVNLDLEINFKMIVVKDKDLQEVLKATLEDQLPDGFDLASSQLQYETKVSNVASDGAVTLKVRYKASLVPKIDLVKLKSDLVGKKIEVAKEYLNSLPDVVSVEISIKPRLPGPLYTLPRSKNNIKINLVPES